MGKCEVMEGICRLKIGGAHLPIDILECALEYKKVGNPWCRQYFAGYGGLKGVLIGLKPGAPMI